MSFICQRKFIVTLMTVFVFVAVAIGNANSAHAAGYDFGGIYTTTGSCPSGYNESRFKYGSFGFSSDLYYCYRDVSVAGGTEYEFGGVFITESINSAPEISYKVNPLTGSATCPMGYDQKKYGSSATTWNPVFYFNYCSKDVSSELDANRLQNDFGGFFSKYVCDVQSNNVADINLFCKNNTGSADPSSVGSSIGTFAGTISGITYNNSATSNITCPVGYTVESPMWSKSESTILNSDGEKPSKNWLMGYCYNIPVVSTCTDIGLRIQQSTGPTAICAQPGSASSPLKIAKNGIIYSIALVDPSDINATKLLIKLSTGVSKAIQKYVP